MIVDATSASGELALRKHAAGAREHRDATPRAVILEKWRTAVNPQKVAGRTPLEMSPQIFTLSAILLRGRCVVDG